MRAALRGVPTEVTGWFVGRRVPFAVPALRPTVVGWCRSYACSGSVVASPLSTRLETRTKESNVTRVVGWYETRRRNEGEAWREPREVGSGPARGREHYRPIAPVASGGRARASMLGPERW